MLEPHKSSRSVTVPFSFCITDFRGSAQPTTYRMWMQSTFLGAGGWASIYLILHQLWAIVVLGMLVVLV